MYSLKQSHQCRLTETTQPTNPVSLQLYLVLRFCYKVSTYIFGTVKIIITALSTTKKVK